MHAQWHRRLVALTLVIPALLLLTVSAGLARSPDGVWRLVAAGGAPDKPESRKHSTLIYDAGMNRLILFGGDKSPSGGAYSDVWAFPLPCGPWIQLFPDDATDCSSTSRPCRRHGHVATYIPGSPPKMFIHGGKRENGSLIDDTWQMTLENPPHWTLLSPSSAAIDRWHHSMAYFNGLPYFFGGKFPGDYGMCDMWKFDGSQWKFVSGSRIGCCQPGVPEPCGVTVPQRRYYQSQIVDTVNNRMVVFGGEYETDPISDVWWYNPWTPLGPVPAGYSRNHHTASYDPIAQRMVVIGGYQSSLGGSITSAVTSMSTVLASYGSWSTLAPAGSGPGPIAEHAAAYDPVGDRIMVFGGVYQNGSFRNELWALDFADDATPPSPVTDLVFTCVMPSYVKVRWTAPGDDCTTGQASSYDIRYSLSQITDDASFAAATPHTGEPAPAAPGTEQSTTIGGLTSGLTYYFAMKTSDESGNTSSLSNVISTLIPYIPGGVCEDKAQPPEGDNRVETSFGIRDLGPQPTSLPLHVRFGISRSGPVTIEMFDVAGRQVARADLGELAPGEHTRSLSTKSRLAAGLYLVRLHQGSSASTWRVALLQP